MVCLPIMVPKLGTVPISSLIRTCIGLSIGFGMGIGIGQCKYTIRGRVSQLSLSSRLQTSGDFLTATSPELKLN